MLQLMAKWNSWIGSRMFLGVLTALLSGFFFPVGDSPILRILVVALFGYMTFVTSLATSLKEFYRVLNRPWVPLWALFLIHCITPFFAWLVGYLFFPNEYLTRLGYLICASIPVGVTSVIWTQLTKGSVATSLVIVTLDTLIVPLFLPLYFVMIIGQNLELNYIRMVAELLAMITIPSVIGMVLHDWTKGSVVSFSKSFGGFTSKIGFFLVIYINASIVAPEIHWTASMIKIFLVTLLVVSLGYVLGYAGSLVFKKHSYELAITMIYNVGLRNLSFGLVLALTYFPIQTAIPITLGILYQQPLAAIIPHIYRAPSSHQKQR